MSVCNGVDTNEEHAAHVFVQLRLSVPYSLDEMVIVKNCVKKMCKNKILIKIEQLGISPLNDMPSFKMVDRYLVSLIL